MCNYLYLVTMTATARLAFEQRSYCTTGKPHAGLYEGSLDIWREARSRMAAAQDPRFEWQQILPNWATRSQSYSCASPRECPISVHS